MEITRHAKKRLKERCGANKSSSERLVEIAYEKGLKHCETSGRLRKWIDSLRFYEQGANQIRVYGDKLYIFRDTRLITVLQVPNDLISIVQKQLKKK